MRHALSGTAICTRFIGDKNQCCLCFRQNSSCLYDMGFMCECEFLAFTFLPTPLPAAF